MKVLLIVIIILFITFSCKKDKVYYCTCEDSTGQTENVFELPKSSLEKAETNCKKYTTDDVKCAIYLR